MNETDHRSQIIASLDEAAFRNVVLIPLLERIGFRDVVEYHGGASEKGKDIISWYFDPLGHRRYVAFVVKKGNIHGAVGKTGSAAEALYQAQQSFNEPYRDIYDLAELRINECVIVTTGEIKNTAIESISGILRRTNFDLLLRFIDGKRIVDLLSRYMPDYWFNDHMYLELMHEIMGPITALMHSAHMLKDYPQNYITDERRLDQLADTMLQHAWLVVNLVDRQYYLLHRTPLVRPVTAQLIPEIRRSVDDFIRTIAKRSGITIHTNIPENLGAVRIDPDVFRTALHSLLVNAKKYSGAEKRIDIEAEETEHHILIRIRNYGPGIKENHEELIFEPFYSGARGGNGLDLFAARKMFLLMGAELRLTNTKNPTELTVFLLRNAANDSYA